MRKHLRVAKVNDLNEDVSDLFKIVNNRDLKFCDTVTYKESRLVSQCFGRKLQDDSTIFKRHNAKDHSKDSQNASTQLMLTPRKSYLRDQFH